MKRLRIDSLKARKSPAQIERTGRIRNRINLARQTAGLVLALIGLISAALMNGPIQPASAQTVKGSWSFTGSLNQARDSHTLTILPNGNVLISGGQEWPFPLLKTTELYNPTTGQWSLTGSLFKRRLYATATLLRSGQVLAVGVGKGTDVLNSAELYNPATGKWNTTASLNTARRGHTATLLADGRVLVVGGDGSGSAELYDPETLDPAPTAPRIILASGSGKKLFITGVNFHAGAVILLNGQEQESKNNKQNSHTTLIGKIGKKIKAGDRVQVRNPSGITSEEFILTGS